MPAVNVKNDAAITVICGSTGSGKSAWTKRQIRNLARVLVWDIDDEYEPLPRISSKVEFVETLVKRKKGKFRFVGTLKDFDFFCGCAFAWGNCAVVAEEIAGVTSPGKAPGNWHTLISRGRKRGIKLYALTQRPSESDKTVIGNATVLHVGQMSRRKDREYMARELDIEVSEITALQDLQWIEKNMKTHQISKGKLRF